MDIIVILNLVLIIAVILIAIFAGLFFWFWMRSKKKQEEELLDGQAPKEQSTFHGIPRESIYKFLEFDEIKDNMIIRKNRQQYVMVIQCQGVNYDLLSEEEKVAVEEGFVQFLNTLRFPIQLYIQTRSLNLREIVDEYKERVKKMQEELDALNVRIRDAERRGNQKEIDKLNYERRRKENVLEYGADIADYVGRLSLNKNVLQQRNYVVVSYYASEFSGGDKYSKEEIDNICFGELYTRCQSIIRSLSSSSVLGKVLTSEELGELLYIAYNRDESEIMQLSKALDAQYDALYSTAKDVLQKKQAQIEEQLEVEAVNLATESILEADRIRKKELSNEDKKKKIKEKALQMIEEYKDQMDADLYEETKKEIVRQAENLEEKTEKKKQTSRTKSKKGE